jgi:hypothetical protein
MPKRRFAARVVVRVAAGMMIGLTACSTFEESSSRPLTPEEQIIYKNHGELMMGVGGGALAGVGVGAIVGALLLHDKSGALIGAAVGGALGAGVGYLYAVHEFENEQTDKNYEAVIAHAETIGQN